MSYSDLLKDPRWQRKRLEVLELADWKCKNCYDSSATLHVHHTYYAKGRKPWEYETHDLYSLCETCHARITCIVAEVQRIVGGSPVECAEQILGYARAVQCCGYGASLTALAAESPNAQRGIADYLGVPRG